MTVTVLLVFLLLYHDCYNFYIFDVIATAAVFGTGNKNCLDVNIF